MICSGLLAFENALLQGECFPVLGIGRQHGLETIESFRESARALKLHGPSQTRGDCLLPGLGIFRRLHLAETA